MSEQPHHSDIPHLLDWANAMAFCRQPLSAELFAGDAACGGGVGDAEKHCLMRLNISVGTPVCIVNFSTATTGVCRRGACR